MSGSRKLPSTNPDRSGSHAGRGFRYQDSVGAWLAIAGWSGVSPYGLCIPEGHDDFELVGSTGVAFVQVKSRRNGLGLFPPGAAVEHILDLWTRYERADVKPDALILIVERPISGWLTSSHVGELGTPLPEAAPQEARLRKDARYSALSPKTRILLAPNPFEETLGLLVENLNCSPLAAQVYYGDVHRRIGELADENGVARKGSFQGLAKADVEHLLSALRPMLDLAAMEAAVATGLCAPIDFLTPLHDPNFFLGVDVLPGHIAAGLVAERPEARARILDALESRSAVLVAGPSGAGKSALMWEAAAASRHVVRWFRVRRLAREDLAVLLRFVQSLRASARSPVGFVFDDVGRDLVAGWDALVREIAPSGAIVALGSIREEDLFLLDTRPRAEEVRDLGTDELATRIWKELRDRGQTEWSGWREPWAESRGLLLEYMHILTSGRRLADLIGEQVARRVRERRELELQVLKVVSVAGVAGASVEVDRLRSELGAVPADLSVALGRLLEEHLVRLRDDGRLAGLHPLRSAALMKATHDDPQYDLASTGSQCVRIVGSGDLEPLLAQLTVLDNAAGPKLLAAATERIRQNVDATSVAAVLRGIARGHIVQQVRAWLVDVDRLEIPRTQATLAAMFAPPGLQVPDLERLKPVAEAASLLRQRQASDPRTEFLNGLGDAALGNMVTSPDAVALEDLLASMVGSRTPNALQEFLCARDMQLSSIDLTLVARLLETAGVLGPETPKAWVTREGQENLLARVKQEIPWATEAHLDQIGDLTIVSADIRYVCPSAQEGVHDSVVSLCELLLAIAPSAELAASSALAADDIPAGLLGVPPMAVKHIPRSNLPPKALTSWNRRWLDAVAYEVGAASYTSFLEAAFDALAKLTPAFEGMFDQILRGRIDEKFLALLGDVHLASRALTPPRNGSSFDIGAGSTSAGAIHVVPIQSVLFDASADAFRRYDPLPDGAVAYVGWLGSLLDHIEQSRAEPWHLINRDPSELLDRLARAISSVQLIAGEAHARKLAPKASWLKLGKSARAGNALRLINSQVEASLRSRTSALLAEISKQGKELGIDLEVRARRTRNDSFPWPPVEVLLIIQIQHVDDWPKFLIAHFDALRNAVGDGRRLVVVPAFGKLAIGRLTVQGVSTPLPFPGKYDDWLQNEGYEIVEDACARNCDEAISALAEVDGARQFGYGGEGRPILERTAVANARERLNIALDSLKVLLEPLAPGAADSIADFVQKVERQEFALAIEAAAIQHGEESDLQPLLASLSAAMVAADVLRRLDPQK